MALNESAAMSYNPGDDEQAATDGIQGALVKAEQQLLNRKGFKGLGMTKLVGGQDAIIVYVEDQQTLKQLPADVDGIPVVGEVTGEIRAL